MNADSFQPKPTDHYHFVTGKLAEHAVEQIVAQLSKQYGFDYSIGVMPITVAALMTPRWLRRHLDVPAQATHVIVPGYCQSGRDELQETLGIPVICGPKDCRSLPEWFGGQSLDDDFGSFDIEIIAEINHAPRLSMEQLISTATGLRDQGADVIDYGCDPANRYRQIGDAIAALVDLGLRVSVDTFDAWEAQQAVNRGAELVLSVNSNNREAAADWGCEVVVIPDAPNDKKSLHETLNFLSKKQVATRLDPILEPIGAGFMSSLSRYAALRDEFPDHEMMMGIGNLTELTDADSAAINLLLLGICQELGIRSVLTTQVINWAQTSVAECDIARRLTHYSIEHGIPPKRLSEQLVILRDAKLRSFPAEVLESLAADIKDNNYRIFAQDQQLHLLSSGLHLQDTDPFRLFDQLLQQPAAENVDAGHAFYLGFELCKAMLALQLGKQYQQDQALDWGHLTVEEKVHRLARRKKQGKHQ